jgi:hypothetical protein
MLPVTFETVGRVFRQGEQHELGLVPREQGRKSSDGEEGDAEERRWKGIL